MKRIQYMTTHTPLPWKLTQESIDPEWHIITANGGRIIANVHIEQGNIVDRGNAAVLTAAPELLDALYGMMNWARRVTSKNPGPEIAEAMNAIAKAEGRTT